MVEGINTKKVKRISPDGEEKEYNSAKDAAEDNNIHSGQIARSVKDGKTVKGYRYVYVEKEEMKIPKRVDKSMEIFRRKPYLVQKLS